MLTCPLLDKLQTLKFYGMLKALDEQMNMTDIDTPGLADRPGTDRKTKPTHDHTA